jgi:hypothetical protein
MLDADESHRSCRLLQLELEAGLLPPPATAPPLVVPPPPAERALTLPPCGPPGMPLCGSSTPIGYIYGATPDPDGGLLTAASTFFSHQGHQVVHDPCPDLDWWDLGGLATIIPIDHLPDHILSLSLELMEGLFAPSPVEDILGTLFITAYLSSPPPVDTSSGASLQGPRSSGGPSSTSPLTRGIGFGGQPMGGVPQTQGLVSVGGLPKPWPLGGFCPASSSVGGTGVNGLTLGGVPHTSGQAGLVPSLASSFIWSPPSHRFLISHVEGVSVSSLGPSSPCGFVLASQHVHHGDFGILGVVLGSATSSVRVTPTPAPPPQPQQRHFAHASSSSVVWWLLAHLRRLHCGPVLGVNPPFHGCPKTDSQWSALQRIIWGAYVSSGQCLDEGYHGGHLLSSSSAKSLGPASSPSSTFRHGGESNSSAYDALDWGASLADDQSPFTMSSPLPPCPLAPSAHGLSPHPEGPPPSPSLVPVLATPIPLPVDHFTLPPIDSSNNYLCFHDLILFWLCSPSFSIACDESLLITDSFVRASFEHPSKTVLFSFFLRTRV